MTLFVFYTLADEIRIRCLWARHTIKVLHIRGVGQEYDIRTGRKLIHNLEHCRQHNPELGGMQFGDDSFRYHFTFELNGEFTLKRFVEEDGCGWLVPANLDYPKWKITENDQFSIWGTVTYIIHQARD